MEEGSIVYDLILMAGGITDKGSLDDINQAREIKKWRMYYCTFYR